MTPSTAGDHDLARRVEVLEAAVFSTDQRARTASRFDQRTGAFISSIAEHRSRGDHASH
jgi:hypothetical protein